MRVCGWKKAPILNFVVILNSNHKNLDPHLLLAHGMPYPQANIINETQELELEKLHIVATSVFITIIIHYLMADLDAAIKRNSTTVI